MDTNNSQNQSEQTTDNEQFIGYCGLYCKACPAFKSGKCDGCRVISAKSAVYYKKCEVKSCCAENGFFTCADCTIHASTKDCKKYNPLLLKIQSWIGSVNRSKCIEMIKEKGRAEFLAFMEEKNWVMFKTKETFLNSNFGKKENKKQSKNDNRDKQ
jgi:hypothetical protein